MATTEQITYMTKSVVFHLNTNNVIIMANKISALQVVTKRQFMYIAEIIHEKALSNTNFTRVNAELCARLVKNKAFNESIGSKMTFLSEVLQICSDKFYSFQKHRQSHDKKAFCDNITMNENIRCLANCRFISELYKQGVFPEKIIWSFFNDLLKENGNLQLHCLCILLKLSGPKLSKNYNMTEIIDHVFFLGNKSSRKQGMSSTLKKLILKIKKEHKRKRYNHEKRLYDARCNITSKRLVGDDHCFRDGLARQDNPSVPDVKMSVVPMVSQTNHGLYTANDFWIFIAIGSILLGILIFCNWNTETSIL